MGTHSNTELIEQLYQLPHNLKAEIVDTTIVPLSPAGGLSSRTSGMIFVALHHYSQLTGSGVALPGNAAFLVDLPRRGSFSPDASYCIDLVPDENFVNGTPIFAAEVRSKHDYGPKAEEAIRAKIADYFAAGTLVVWDVDALRDKTIRVYRASQPDQPTLYGMGEEAEAEPALPGWRVAVDTLLSNTRRRSK
jgi:Uma2 family endonuclease